MHSHYHHKYNASSSTKYPPPIVYGYPPKEGQQNNENNKNNVVHMPWLPQTNVPPPPPPPAEPSGTDLFRAVESGDLAMVHYFISKAMVPAKFTDPVGNTTLHVAARKGHSQIANYLIEQGVDPNTANERGHTPVMWAVTNGHLPTLASLVKKGANTKMRDHKGCDALLHAAMSGHLFILHYLIVTGKADVNVRDDEGHTALSWACTNGHLLVVEYLLSNLCPTPIHIGTIDQSGRTAMHWAAHSNRPKIIALLHKARCRACNTSDITDKEREREIEIEAELYSYGQTEEELEKIEKERKERIAKEIERERDCKIKIGEEMKEVRDIEGQTPAECARSKGYNNLSKKITSGNWIEKKPSQIEPVLQFLSSFVPHFILFQFIIPSFPFWVPLIVALIWVHANIDWSVPQKTLIPAGLMGSGVILIERIYYENLPFFWFGIISTAIAYGLYSFYMLMTEDPGFIIPDHNDFVAALTAAEFGVEPVEFCRLCKVRKPPRSKHCRVCNKCSHRFDHHCYWIYNCVAEKNLWRFYVFLIQVLCHVGFFVIYDAYLIYHDSLFATIGDAFIEYKQLSWAFCFVAAVWIPVISLFSYHTNFISRDVTTYELLRPSRGIKPQKASTRRLLAFLLHGSRIFDTGEDAGVAEV